MEKINFHDFARECYLRSVPSIDLDEVSPENPIDCRDYKLKESEYNRILSEFGIESGTDLMVACGIWLVQSGPSIIRD